MSKEPLKPSLFDFWLTIDPPSEEVRRSISLRIIFFLEARRRGLVDPVEIGLAYEAFLRQEAEQPIN